MRLLQLNSVWSFAQTAEANPLWVMPEFCADPVRIWRLESTTADSSTCPAKNANAVCMVARINAMKGAATIANSSAAVPSSRRAKPAGDASRLRPEASLFLRFVNIPEELQFVPIGAPV